MLKAYRPKVMKVLARPLDTDPDVIMVVEPDGGVFTTSRQSFLDNYEPVIKGDTL